MALFFLHLTIPVPRWSKPLLSLLYAIHFGIPDLIIRVLSIFYVSPVFRSRCASVGARLSVERMPRITGKVRIHLGDNVLISGRVAIGGGRIFDEPELRVGNNVFIGHQCSFSIGKRIEIGDHVYIAGGTNMADYDGHPIEALARANGVQVAPEKVRPIVVGRHAWIGRNCIILKGVTIGEGAIVGGGSVVRSDVAPNTIVAGNPAQFVRAIIQPEATMPL